MFRFVPFTHSLCSSLKPSHLTRYHVLRPHLHFASNSSTLNTPRAWPRVDVSFFRLLEPSVLIRCGGGSDNWHFVGSIARVSLTHESAMSTGSTCPKSSSETSPSSSPVAASVAMDDLVKPFLLGASPLPLNMS